MYTNYQWTTGEILVDYGYAKFKESLRKHIHFRESYFTTMPEEQQQSPINRQQLLILQEQLETNRRMRRNMVLQLEKIQESSAHGNISAGYLFAIYYISEYYYRPTK